MDEPDKVIGRALNGIFCWAQGRLEVNRRERIHWGDLRDGAPKAVIDALHDAGFTIVQMGVELEPSVTSKAVTPYSVEIRAEVPIPAAGIVWTTYRIDARMAAHRRYVEQDLPRLLAHHLLRPLEEPLAEKLAAFLAEVKFEEWQNG